MLRLFLVLTFPFAIVLFAKSFGEFEYPLDVTNLIGTQVNAEIQNIDQSNQYFQSITRINLPFIYDVFVYNNVFVYLEASHPTSTPSKTTILFNDKIQISYKKLEKLSTFSLQFKNKEEVLSFLRSQNIKIKFDDFKGAFIEPKEYFRLKIDEEQKNIIFYFKLTNFSKLVIYLLVFFTTYPILLNINGLRKFVTKGEPFNKKE